MKSVWFIVPAHGRVDLTRVCLRQLARTCAELARASVHATAVVIADDENIDTAEDLGFAVVRRDNEPLGRKWNDGYQLACDPAFNPHPADFVIPFGSDDWIDAELVLRQTAAPSDELRCSRLSCVVNEDATRLRRLNVNYRGRLDFGDGVRVIPSWLLERVGYRPAEEDARRAIDTSVFRRLERLLGRQPRVMFSEVHSFQIVDWKSTAQLNSYGGCSDRFGVGGEEDPFVVLAPHYPAAALDEMRALHRQPVAA